MSFLDQLKQMKQIKDIQDQLNKERMEVEKEGIRAVVNGKMEVEQIVLNPNLAKDQQEKLAKECINEAMKKVQMSAAQKFMQSQS
jgi:DNA-binding protein YbaB